MVLVPPLKRWAIVGCPSRDTEAEWPTQRGTLTLCCKVRLALGGESANELVFVARQGMSSIRTAHVYPTGTHEFVRPRLQIQEYVSHVK